MWKLKISEIEEEMKMKSKIEENMKARRNGGSEEARQNGWRRRKRENERKAKRRHELSAAKMNESAFSIVIRRSSAIEKRIIPNTKEGGYYSQCSEKSYTNVSSTVSSSSWNKWYRPVKKKWLFWNDSMSRRREKCLQCNIIGSSKWNRLFSIDWMKRKCREASISMKYSLCENRNVNEETIWYLLYRKCRREMKKMKAELKKRGECVAWNRREEKRREEADGNGPMKKRK